MTSDFDARIDIDRSYWEYRHVNFKIFDAANDGDAWQKLPITITCQMDAKSKEPYGYRIMASNGYMDGYTLTDAEKGLKVLRAIDRKLLTMSQKYGYPGSYGAYCLRIANICKVQTIRCWRDEDRSAHDFPVEELGWRIDSMIRTCLRELGQDE